MKYLPQCSLGPLSGVVQRVNSLLFQMLKPANCQPLSTLHWPLFYRTVFGHREVAYVFLVPVLGLHGSDDLLGTVTCVGRMGKPGPTENSLKCL